MKRPLGAVAFCGLLASCGAQGPVPIDRGAACASCRMIISDPKLAAEIVAPGEEPRFYDDIGCLRDAVQRGDMQAMGEGATAYVADHRTGAWVKASKAVYARVESLSTPMGSHLAAYTDAASRAADGNGDRAVALTSAEVFGPTGGTRDAR